MFNHISQQTLQTDHSSCGCLLHDKFVEYDTVYPVHALIVVISIADPLALCSSIAWPHKSLH